MSFCKGIRGFTGPMKISFFTSNYLFTSGDSNYAIGTSSKSKEKEKPQKKEKKSEGQKIKK